MAAQPIFSSSLVLTPAESKTVVERISKTRLSDSRRQQLEKFSSQARSAFARPIPAFKK